MSDEYIDAFIPSEEPDYHAPCADGEAVLVTGTLYNTNSVGGTEILDYGGNECVVTKSFWDYEIGWRFHVRVVDDVVTEEFRRQATSEFTPDYYREKYPTQPQHYERVKEAHDAFDPGYVYFSEHDLAPSHNPAL